MPEVRIAHCPEGMCRQQISVGGVQEGEQVVISHVSDTEIRVTIRPRVLPVPDDAKLGKPIDPNIVDEVESGGGRF